MKELASGLTKDQLEKLRVKALKAANECEYDDNEKRSWRTLADTAHYLILISEDVPRYRAGISEDTESLQASETLSANDRLTATKVQEMLGINKRHEHSYVCKQGCCLDETGVLRRYNAL